MEDLQLAIQALHVLLCSWRFGIPYCFYLVQAGSNVLFSYQVTGSFLSSNQKTFSFILMDLKFVKGSSMPAIIRSSLWLLITRSSPTLPCFCLFVSLRLGQSTLGRLPMRSLGRMASLIAVDFLIFVKSNPFLIFPSYLYLVVTLICIKKTFQNKTSYIIHFRSISDKKAIFWR